MHPWAQPVRAFKLFSQDKPGGDSDVARKKLAQELWTVALAASMQQDDVIGQAMGAIEDLFDGG